MGPAFGRLAHAKLEVTGVPTEDMKDMTRSLDVSLVAGVGVNVSRLLVEGRFMAGLQDIDKVKNSGGTTTRNRSFTVLVGVRF